LKQLKLHQFKIYKDQYVSFRISM